MTPGYSYRLITPFTDLDTGGDFSVHFDLDSNFGEYWQLIVTLRYLNFMCEDDEMKEENFQTED